MDIDEAIEAQLVLTPQQAAADVLAYLPVPSDIPPVLDVSPAERLELARAHEVLERVEKAVRARRQAIELAFLRAAADRKLDQIKLAGGVVRVIHGKSNYETKGEAIRDKLLLLARTEGNVTQEEIDAAVPTIIVTKPNHTKLNYLARHRGEAVEEAIESNRKKVDPDPLSARLEFHFEGGVR